MRVMIRRFMCWRRMIFGGTRRRHSAAMAVAMTVRTTRGQPEKYSANLQNTSERAALNAGVSTRLVDACRYVRDHAPQLIDAVLAGTIRAAAAEAEAKRVALTVRTTQGGDRKSENQTANLQFDSKRAGVKVVAGLCESHTPLVSLKSASPQKKNRRIAGNSGGKSKIPAENSLRICC